MREYHKIEGLWARDPTTQQIMPGNYRNPLFEYLKDNLWTFSEKLDGMNIRVGWNGHKVQVGGRTDNAQIPAILNDFLWNKFTNPAAEELFEQKFNTTDVMLFGEGVGHKIQRGDGYTQLDESKQKFVLFDVLISNTWMPREFVKEIGGYFGVDVAPEVAAGTLADGVEFVRNNPWSMMGPVISEGVIGRPFYEILDRHGKRVIVKIKAKDHVGDDRRAMVALRAVQI